MTMYNYVGIISTCRHSCKLARYTQGYVHNPPSSQPYFNIWVCSMLPLHFMFTYILTNIG